MTASGTIDRDDALRLQLGFPVVGEGMRLGILAHGHAAGAGADGGQGADVDEAHAEPGCGAGQGFGGARIAGIVILGRAGPW